ncbi:MAG: hypothetical protein B7Z41_07750 [Rhizobiales bacterium 12-66-7]|nr:MAG: hypothetical protein B7Z41_07750 [Rhizobiales bacterium 12-66-7]
MMRRDIGMAPLRPSANLTGALVHRLAEEIRSGRQLIIFPEGTRRPVGAPRSFPIGPWSVFPVPRLQTLDTAHAGRPIA